MDRSLHKTPSDAIAPGQAPSVDSLDLRVTAEDAYPKLERAFLQSESEVTASFHIADLSTRLQSDEARRIGRTWIELLVHTIDRGVRVRLVVSDFDPGAAPDSHKSARQTLRQVAAVRELARDDAQLEVKIALHDARTGLLPWPVFYPLVRRNKTKLANIRKDMNKPGQQRVRADPARRRRMCHDKGKGRLPFTFGSVNLCPAEHHQKMAVFDRKTLYIGGLDLNDQGSHTKPPCRAAARTWHDIQAIATGPVVEAAQFHLESFLETAADRAAPPKGAPGFLRTLSRRRRGMPVRMAPKSVLREIEARHLQAVRNARNLIYLETQALRHVPLARALAKRARACPDLRLIVVLPAASGDRFSDSNAGWNKRFGEHRQMRCLARLHHAFGPERFVAASPVQPWRKHSDGQGAPSRSTMIHVPSQVSIFDDFGAIVSSANLNTRSMKWNTEAGLYLDHPEHVQQVRTRAMGHWLPGDAGPAYVDPETAFDGWRRLLETNSALPPAQRRGLLVRYDSDVAREVAAPTHGIPDGGD